MKGYINQWWLTGVVGRSGTIEAGVGAGSSLDIHGGLEWHTWTWES